MKREQPRSVFRKGDPIMVSGEDGQVRLVKIVKVCPIVRHYLARDKRGRLWTYFVNTQGECWCVPEDR